MVARDLMDRLRAALHSADGRLTDEVLLAAANLYAFIRNAYNLDHIEEELGEGRRSFWAREELGKRGAQYLSLCTVRCGLRMSMLVLPCLHYRFWNLELIRSMELILCVV